MIKASAVLPGVVAEVIRNAPLSPEKVTMAWRLSVGPAVAKATTVRLDEEGVLHVEAGSPAWASAVRKSRSLILNRLQQLLGEDTVRQIHFD